MPSTKKTKKAAKPATTKAVAKAGQSKASKAKASVSKATSARSKSKSVASSSRTSARSAAKPAAKSAAAKSASSKSAASKSKARPTTAARGGAKTARPSAATKTRAVARSTAKSASKTARTKTAQAKTARAKAAKAEKTKSSAKSVAAKASVTRKKLEVVKASPAKAKIVQKIDQKAKKPVESPVRLVKEASPEQFKNFHNQKASSDTQSQSKQKLKPVQPAVAQTEAVPTRLAPSKAATSDARPIAEAKTAPDPRPASSAPVVQPRDTSEQNPVTQKKTTSPIPAKAVPEPEAPVAAAIPALAPVVKAKPTGAKLGFKTNEHIVYPAHGVGQIVAIEEQEVAGFKLELFVISFIKDKMILKVPTPKVVSVGMRKLAEPHVITRSLDTLTGRARIKRTMWSRRAQEYEAKINSGDLIAIAEVVRDLYRSEAQPEQSYSERQLYEAALDRMSRELAVVQKMTEQESLKQIEAQLQKGPRRGAKTEAEVEADVESNAGDIDEAA